jgi:hypothetical protein
VIHVIEMLRDAGTAGTTGRSAALRLQVEWHLWVASALQAFSGDFLRIFSSVLSSVRPGCVAGLSPLALMNSASEVPIGSSTSKGRCHSRSVLALG